MNRFLFLVAVMSSTALAGCSSSPQSLVIQVEDSGRAAIEAFLTPIGDDRLGLDRDERRGRGTVTISLETTLDCTECYRVSGSGNSWTVEGGDLLGIQYGLADMLERWGYRFFHPHHTRLPAELVAPANAEAEEIQRPEIATRGMQVHTLHPTEGYFDLWEPGAENLAGAKLIIDWLVKQRANHLQWVGLDNISSSNAELAEWKAHTAQIIEEAHMRGMTAGLAIQLFGSGNLQQAWDMLDSTAGNTETALRNRWAEVVTDTPFDSFHMSFGEFFAEGAQEFIDQVNQAYSLLQELAPGTHMTGHIHVGDDLQITYNGEEMIYYFLVQFTDPGIEPQVHTVMYYNMYDDAGGAYHHDLFDQHRTFLEQRLLAEEPVSYFPETAYWIAFDVSVPTWLPLYARSRWVDLWETRQFTQANQVGILPGHTLFSSGWEWGYWQGDYASLRHSYRLEEDWASPIAHAYAPLGEAGVALAAVTEAVGSLQYEALIGQRLAAYMAGVDAAMDAGRVLGLMSQPLRPSFSSVAAMTAEESTAMQQDVLVPLATLADEMEAQLVRLPASTVLPSDQRWLEEIRDGLMIDVIRARFVGRLFSAALSASLGEEDVSWEEEAETLLAEARVVVDRRHADLHDPRPERLLTHADNATIYNFGYLLRADQLCYWQRELSQARNALAGASEQLSACLFE